MRPRGEVRLALLSAAPPLSSPAETPGATVRELAAQTQVGLGAAIATVKNMTRSGDLCITGRRKVPHRRRPVAEYKRRPALEESTREQADPEVALLAGVLHSWTKKQP